MLYPKDPSVETTPTVDAIEFEWRRKAVDGLPFMLLGFFVLVASAFATNAPLASGEPRSIGERLILILLCSSFALPVAYFGAVLTLNSTRIIATRETVSRKSGPLWQAKPLTLPAKGIKQFFAIGTSEYRMSHGYATGNIYVIDANDHVWKLATTLPSAFAANQICHELEDFYGIEDLPVYGVTTDPAHPGPRP